MKSLKAVAAVVLCAASTVSGQQPAERWWSRPSGQLHGSSPGPASVVVVAVGHLADDEVLMIVVLYALQGDAECLQ